MKKIKQFLFSKVPVVVYLVTFIVLLIELCVVFRTYRNIEPSNDIKGFYQARVEEDDNLIDVYNANFDGKNYEIYYSKIEKHEIKNMILTNGTYKKLKDNVYLLKDGEKRYIITLLHNKFYFQVPEQDNPMSEKMDTVLEFITDGFHCPTIMNSNAEKIKLK